MSAPQCMSSTAWIFGIINAESLFLIIVSIWLKPAAVISELFLQKTWWSPVPSRLCYQRPPIQTEYRSDLIKGTILCITCQKRTCQPWVQKGVGMLIAIKFLRALIFFYKILIQNKCSNQMYVLPLSQTKLKFNVFSGLWEVKSVTPAPIIISLIRVACHQIIHLNLRLINKIGFPIRSFGFL